MKPVGATMKDGLVAAVFACALFQGLVPGAMSTAVAQHAIDPEKWVEMRTMFREKGPVPTIQEDVAALAGVAPARCKQPAAARRPAHPGPTAGHG